jgi:heme o synthase
MIKTYLLLTKPGIIFGNSLAAIAGFAFASEGNWQFSLFLTTIIGLGLIIASACVFNNYTDRHIDKKMKRTRGRALAQHMISGNKALIFASSLGIAGILLLGLFGNGISLLVALIGFSVYVVPYGFFKRRSVYGTLIGSIAGATPPLVGYVAVTGEIDLAAILLFAVLFFWQMPHFFAIAIYRLNDYKAAAIPVLPVKKGIKRTKLNMLFYTIAFSIAVLSLNFTGYTGTVYLIAMTSLCLLWIKIHLDGISSSEHVVWARGVFRFSLIVLTVLCVLLIFDTVLP